MADAVSLQLEDADVTGRRNHGDPGPRGLRTANNHPAWSLLMPVACSPVRRSAARQNRLFCLLPVVLALAACGGGSDSTDTAPVVPPPATPLTLSGTAATGAAIASAALDIKCNGGSTTATTGADGSYSVSLTAGALPCVLRVTAGDGTVLHSLATGTGSAAKANITPVSELVMANLSGGTPASYFSAFDATAATALTAAKADAAVTAVVATLKAAGVDLTDTGNVLTATLVAANGTTAGNAFDQVLDALKAKLTTNNPGTGFKDALATLADAVAKTSPAAPMTSLSNTPSLPAELLLQPAAANCSALRSGKYRLVYNRNHPASEGHDTTVLTIDATTLKFTDADGTVDALTPNGNCRFKTPANGDLVVSQAGVIVGQIDDGGTFHLGIAFPEQTHPVSALAGEWNTLQLDRTEDGGPIVLTNGTWTLDATGKLTAATFCEPGVPCFTGTLAATADFPIINHTVNASGGFNSGNAGATAVYSDRVFLYRTGGGELLRVSVTDAGGHVSLATRKVASTLPAEGRVLEFWNITQNPNYTASSITEGKNTVRTLNAAAGSFLRDSRINATTGVTRPETLKINALRDGYTERVAETVTASDGSSSAVGSFIALGLRGTGISVVAIPSSNSVALSINK
jgi:hypothetical protein